MPKPVLATAAELADAKVQLQDEIVKCGAKISPAVQACETKLQGVIQALTDKVNKNEATGKEALDRVATDAKGFTENGLKNLEQKITVLFPPLRQEIDNTRNALETQLKKQSDDLNFVVSDQIKIITERFDAQLREMVGELKGDVESLRKEAAENLAAERASIDEVIAAVRQEFQDRDNAVTELLRSEMQQETEKQAARAKDQDDRNDRAQSEIYLRLSRLDDVVKELRDDAMAETARVEKDVSEGLASYRAEADSRLDFLDTEATKFRDAVSEVENQATRRVDWVIKGASQALSHNENKVGLHTSFFSPKFNAAGAHGLQLELQLFRPQDPPVEGDAVGDLAVYLWACKGMHLGYRVYIGKKSLMLEKLFNGRVPYGTPRFCFLKEQINRADDTLKVSVEILEAVRMVDHPIKIPPDESGIPAEVDLRPKAVEGTMYFHRHINHRLMDQVKEQVEMMRSRMIRSIDWRVESASKLRQCFPANEPICSATFSAAGIEGLQFIFYPSGYGGCVDGFCSLFIYAPAGVTIKCCIKAGAQRRDCTHVFEKPGAFGRTNFARFEAIVDETDDSIMIGLEVYDAQQDMTAKVAHPPVRPGDTRGIQEIEGYNSEPVTSVVKLTRAPGKVLSGLEDRRVLPSLWTAKNLSDQGGGGQDGMYSFQELPSGQGRGAAALRSPSGHTAGSRLPDSLPGSPDATRYGGQDAGLPQLAQTHTGGEGYDCGGGRTRKTRNGNMRRSKSMANTMPTSTMSPLAV